MVQKVAKPKQAWKKGASPDHSKSRDPKKVRRSWKSRLAEIQATIEEEANNS